VLWGHATAEVSRGPLEADAGVDPKAVHLGFVMENTKLWKGFLRSLQSSPFIIIPPLLRNYSSFIYYNRHYINLVKIGVIKQQKSVFFSPDQATLEGSSCTSIMTYTRGSGYSF